MTAWPFCGTLVPTLLRKTTFYERIKAQSFRLAVTGDGSQLVTGSRDGVVWLWDLDQLLPKVSIEHGGEISDLAITTDGQMLATAGRKGATLRVWDLPSGSEKWSVVGQPGSNYGEGSILGVAFSRHSDLLAATGTQGIKLYDRDLGTLNATIDTEGYWTRGPYFLPDGRLVCGQGTSIGIWKFSNADTPVSIHGSHSDAIVNVAVSFDGKMIASCSSDGTVLLLNANDAHPFATLKGHSGPVHSVGFSPDGRTLLTGGTDGKLKLWDIETRAERFSFEGHDGPVSTAAFAPDGLTVISGGVDGTVRLWHASQMAE